MLLLYVFLLLSFLQIGLAGYGGSVALLSFVEHEVVVRHGWLTSAEFADLTAFCRVLPGDVPLNAAALTGYRALVADFGFWAAMGGALVAVFALVVPSFVWVGVADRCLARVRREGIVESVLLLLRPLVPGLVAAAALLLMTPENFGSPAVNPWHFGISVFLFVFTLIGVGYYRFHPLFILFLSGLAGWLLF